MIFRTSPSSAPAARQLLCWCLLALLCFQTIGMIHRVTHRVSHQLLSTVAAEAQAHQYKAVSSVDRLLDDTSDQGATAEWGHPIGGAECQLLDQFAASVPLLLMLAGFGVLKLRQTGEALQETPVLSLGLWRRGARGPPILA